MCFTPKSATISSLDSPVSARTILPGPTPDYSAGVKPEAAATHSYQIRFNYVRPSTQSKGFKTFGDFTSYAEAHDAVQVTLDTLDVLAQRHFEKIEIISVLESSLIPKIVLSVYTPADNLGGVPTTEEVLADRLTGATALRDVYTVFYDFAATGYPLVEDESRTFGPEDQEAVRSSFTTLVRAGNNTVQALQTLKAMKEELFTPEQQGEAPDWLQRLFDGGSAFRVNLDNGIAGRFDPDSDPGDEDQGNNDIGQSYDDYDEDTGTFEPVEDEDDDEENEDGGIVGTTDPVSPWQGCGSKRQ